MKYSSCPKLECTATCPRTRRLWLQPNKTQGTRRCQNSVILRHQEPHCRHQGHPITQGLKVVWKTRTNEGEKLSRIKRPRLTRAFTSLGPRSRPQGGGRSHREGDLAGERPEKWRRVTPASSGERARAAEALAVSFFGDAPVVLEIDDYAGCCLMWWSEGDRAANKD